MMRKKGISGVIRHIGSANMLKCCLESVCDFFDEIICIYNKINGFKFPNGFDNVTSLCWTVRPRQFLFEKNESRVDIFLRDINEIINHKRKPIDSYSFSCLSNVGLSLCSYSHVSPNWDSDMIMDNRITDEFGKEKLYKTVLNKNQVLVKGCLLQKEKQPVFENYHPRFWRMSDKIYFSDDIWNGDMISYRTKKWLKSFSYLFLYPKQYFTIAKNTLSGDDYYYPNPMYIHLRDVKDSSNQVNKIRIKECRRQGGR